MKKHFKVQVVIVFVIALLINSSASADPNLTMQWGLENKRFFQETEVPADASSAIRAQAKPGEALYRFFQINDYYNDVIMGVFRRFHESWNKYSENKSSDVSIVKKEFSGYLRRNDPRLSSIIQQMAPTVYFDFLGDSGVQYVLQEIEIKTIRFEEYAGGGFADNEAWYDIELKHLEGIYKYPIGGKKLRFTGSGRTVLRFWSDNYYESMGMAPMGCYDIDITFHFFVNGSRISISSGRFKIDV
ncbi:hypothetical protein [uncultured Desulfobacter sp.]|uniref:hypothetical protein n=1 Tax=uncultured Desulfobacter sp. TaxID=240139 RepID=UPI002AAACE21|nr:hypothetical protein [uncultured Desulfobacter sp.]